MTNYNLSENNPLYRVRLTRAQISNRLNQATMREWYGPRCGEYEPECVACQNWARYDAIAEQIAEVQKLKHQMLGARIKAEELVFQQLKDHADLLEWANEGEITIVDESVSDATLTWLNERMGDKS